MALKGVIICHPDPAGWSANLERDLGLSPQLLQNAFFAPHWHDIIHGRAGLRERLEPMLADIAPDLDCADLIDYWFRNDAHLNGPLFDELRDVRQAGIQVHLATVQEHERARFLWEALDFQAHFDAMHYAADLGCAKPHPDFFRQIEQRTGFSLDSLFFVDDKPANVEAARARGWAAACWTGERSLMALLREAGFSSDLPDRGT